MRIWATSQWLLRAARCSAAKPSSFLASTSCRARARILRTALQWQQRLRLGVEEPKQQRHSHTPAPTHSAWPLRAARCSRVKPWLLVAMTSVVGTSVRTSTMPLAPAPAEMAQCRGVSAWASCQQWVMVTGSG